jgi:hypothetical protein
VRGRLLDWEGRGRSLFFGFLIFFLRKIIADFVDLGEFVEPVDFVSLLVFDPLEEFSNFQFFIFFKDLNVFGFEMQIDSGVSGEPFLAETDVQPTHGVVKGLGTLARVYLTHPLNYYQQKNTIQRQFLPKQLKLVSAFIPSLSQIP